MCQEWELVTRVVHVAKCMTSGVHVEDGDWVAGVREKVEKGRQKNEKRMKKQ